MLALQRRMGVAVSGLGKVHHRGVGSIVRAGLGKATSFQAEIKV
jgi:hypothetical protein